MGEHMAEIRIEHLKKCFGQECAVKDISLIVPDASFTIFLGPSGCGKTTTLRMIAGLESPDQGDIYIGGRRVNDTPPGKRGVAMVFQNYALYPMMTVQGNIEFGLKNRGVPKAERKKRVEEVARIVDLSAHLHKKPHALSGGQRQRVALARAIVKNPDVFLMDEPLSNLDAKLRMHMRAELIRIHQQLSATFVYVTHDQSEAMAMGDQIIVMKSGTIQQSGTPWEIYHKPANVYVATFIGTPPMNIFQRETLQSLLNLNYHHNHGSRHLHPEAHWLGIRPERIILLPKEHASQESTTVPSVALSTGVQIPGRVLTREMLGAETIYHLDTQLGLMQAKVYLAPPLEDDRISLFLPFEALHQFDHEERLLIAATPHQTRESIAL
ncbi:MAG: Glycerol-3-phosphate ABC transporter, ATP-binding protein UgpC [Candidatus Carbobacillus altaicus]|uniref:Glycerol-3-phosphate ABC transporter, ATP-binding protein UgpC n=1 Tax=Candidatus Carbonibacillus altaicus TaxID=2163959 RepID=A0A2R6XXM5_9BACL|nr:MAG: Glycerol-3-phosphate ABC transporter, ATP-binding protein UgpC [Candidatus Carbobacillus altaicus]